MIGASSPLFFSAMAWLVTDVFIDSTCHVSYSLYQRHKIPELCQKQNVKLLIIDR